MGSGVLKTLSSDKVPYYQFLYVFSCRSYSSKPCIGLLLQSLGVRSCHRDFLITDASVVDDGIVSSAEVRGPVALVVRFVPRVLGAVATQMSLFMARVTLNFM